MTIIARCLILFLSLWASTSWATVPVMRFPSGTPVQVCQASDTNTACQGSGGGGSGNVGIGTVGRFVIQIGTQTTGTPYNIVANSSGNVGIGSSAPGQALDLFSGNLRLVAGAEIIGTSTGNYNFEINKSNTNDFGVPTLNGIGISNLSTSTASYSSLTLQGNNTSVISRYFVNGLGGAASAFPTAGAAIGSSSNHPFGVYTNSTERMRITSSGNVGIGSTVPGQVLDVQGTIRASSDIKIGSQSVCQANGTNCPSSGSALWVTGNVGINTTNNVGIGTVNPGQVLDVVGTIRSSVLSNTADGPLLFANSNKITPVGGSVVKNPSDLSAGSIAVRAMQVGTSTPLGLLGSYFLGAKGGTKFVDASNNTYFDSGVGGVYGFGDIDSAIHAGRLTIDGTGITSLFGNGVGLYNSNYSSFILSDASGGVTVRADGDSGGLYANADDTYLGNYSTGQPLVIDNSGNVAIQSSGGPTAGQILMVGPDTATGATFSFNGENTGSQVFLDVKSGSGLSVSTRFINPDFGTFIEEGGCANSGEYFINCVAGDGIIKGASGGGQTVHIGSGSGNAPFNVSDTTVWIGSATAPTSGALQVTGNEYVSGNVSIGTTNTPSGKLVVVGGNVGIGTWKPTSALDAVGNNSSGAVDVIQWRGTANSNAVLGSLGTDVAGFLHGALSLFTNSGGIPSKTVLVSSVSASYINTSAGFGLATAAPLSLLEVLGNASVGYHVAAPTNGLIVSGNVGIGTFSPNGKLIVSGGNVGIGTLSPQSLFVVKGGDVRITGSAPSLNSCTGGTFSSGSTDNAFTLTVGAGLTSCSITFNTAKTLTPTCSVSEQTASVINALSYTVSTSGMSFSQTALGGSILDVNCGVH